MTRGSKVREIDAKKIKKAVSDLCIEANVSLREDILSALKKALRAERDPNAKGILKEIIDNAKTARDEKLPICQDTGMAVVYCDIGQELLITGGRFEDAVNEGARDGYRKGYLRKSVVASPLERENTQTNAPCVIHSRIVPGSRMKITVSPKGFGSENKSALAMFKPTASFDEIKSFIIETVKKSGAGACPPLVLGVGMGGTFEKAAQLAKRALLCPVDKKNTDRHLERMEKKLLDDINRSGIGPMGLGGKTTALGVNILEFPTHIAGLPVAVCVSCHATRSAERTI